MIAITGRIRIIFVVVAAAALFPLFLQDAVAETNFAKNGEPVVNEKSVTQTESAHACNPEHCGSAPKGSRSKGIGSLVNGLLAFGCRVNYRLTDWVLSDKCDIDRIEFDNPQKEACN